MDHELVLTNDPAELGRMIAWVAAIGAREQLRADVQYAIDLGLNEAVMNIISHAYDDDARHQITISVRRDGDAAIAVIEDDGKPFDPTHQPLPPLPASLDDARVGGLGLRMMRAFLADLRYQRHQGRNRLTLVALGNQS